MVFNKDVRKPHIILSTDSMKYYGLDMIFDVAKQAGFEGVDLAMRRGFDAWNVKYVQKLVEQYDMPVRAIQTSREVNAKEMNKSVDVANELGAKVLNINAPKMFNVKSYKFIKDNLQSYKKHNRDIDFAIVNPPDSTFIVPISKYHFSNIPSIIKEYKAKLSLDITYIEQNKLEHRFLKKISKFIPNMGLMYISDKNQSGKGHLPLGDGNLKLDKIFRAMKENDYKKDFSLKLDLSKADLADVDKVILMLKKSIDYFDKHFRSIDESS